MARLYGQIMGKPVGKVGDIVFKSLYGKTLIASAPSGFTTPMDEKSVTRRTKFGFVVKLSAALIRSLSLKVLWKKTSKAGKSAFSDFVSKAYDRVDDTLTITSLQLVERAALKIPAPEITINTTSIKFDFEAFGEASGINPLVEKTFSLEGVICLNSPNAEAGMNNPYEFVPFSTTDQPVDLTNPLSVTLAIENADLGIFQGYNVKKVLATLVTKDEEGNPLKASYTIFN